MMHKPILIALGMLLGGCAVGPTYRRPAVQTPTDWKTPLPSEWQVALPSDEAPRGPWWEAFGDDTLNRLEALAVQMNYDLQEAMARVEQARAVARINNAARLPTLELNPSYDHFQRSSSSFGGSGSFTGDIVSVPLDLSYEVDLWGRVHRSFEAAQAEAQASLSASHTVLLTLTADVARTYFGLRTLDMEADILRQTVELRREVLALVFQRLEAGLVSQLDVARARTELASAEVELTDVERQRAELENALAVLCGQNPSEFPMPESARLPKPPRIPPSLTSRVLERRPDVAEAERQVAAANARIGVVQAAYFPVIRLTGSGGLVDSKFESLLDWDNSVWSLGPSVAIPLFAGGRNAAQLRAAKAEYEATVAAYRQRVLTAFQEVEDALVNLRWRAQHAQLQAHILDSSREAASLSRVRYEQGLVNYLEVADAERSRLDAERAAVHIQHQRLASVILFIKALGGGWDTAAPMN